MDGTPNADQIVTEAADEQEAAAISIPRIRAASAVVWEVSTWSTRSAASMNDVDADERRRIIGLRGMAGSSAWEVTPSSANDVRGNNQVSRGLPRAVNNLAVQSLVAAYATNKKIVDESSARVAVTEVTTE